MCSEHLPNELSGDAVRGILEIDRRKMTENRGAQCHLLIHSLITKVDPTRRKAVCLKKIYQDFHHGLLCVLHTYGLDGNDPGRLQRFRN
jgi:hypothetical protein